MALATSMDSAHGFRLAARGILGLFGPWDPYPNPRFGWSKSAMWLNFLAFPCALNDGS
jgi:hypothetical protein